MLRLLHAVGVAVLLALTSTLASATSDAVGTACYRRTIPAANKQCPQGYEFDKALTCWAECPLAFPVECGMECIPQNQDCTKEVIAKVAAVANAALSTASLSVFAEFRAATKGVDIAIRCGQQLYKIMEEVVQFANELEAKFPNTTQDQLYALAMKSDIVAVDLPLAVVTCLDLPVPANMAEIGQAVVQVVKIAVQEAIKLAGKPLTFTSFASISKTMFSGTSAAGVLPNTAQEIQDLVNDGAACGKDIKDVVDQIVIVVKQIKAQNPQSSAAAIRIALGASPVLLNELPEILKSCGSTVSSLANIRKLIDTIVSEVTAATEKDGKPIDKTTYALAVADMALGAIASFDPTGIAALAQEFVEPLCDPTIFSGSVDDGAASTTLGLQTIGQAFDGSQGSWKNTGDGLVKLTFVSADNKDVKVNIKSGGQVVAQVPVPQGKTVVWTKALADLQDKTLYLDRWRPGLLGIPGTGGGSLLVWVPHSTAGHLELTVKLNIS